MEANVAQYALFSVVVLFTIAVFVISKRKYVWDSYNRDKSRLLSPLRKSKAFSPSKYTLRWLARGIVMSLFTLPVVDSVIRGYFIDTPLTGIAVVLCSCLFWSAVAGFFQGVLAATSVSSAKVVLLAGILAGMTVILSAAIFGIQVIQLPILLPAICVAVISAKLGDSFAWRWPGCLFTSLTLAYVLCSMSNPHPVDTIRIQFVACTAVAAVVPLMSLRYDRALLSETVT